MAISRFAQSGDARIHYLDSGGSERGAPIVMVPGMTCVADDYAAVLPLFGRRTVVVDIRGHGKSSSPEHGYDFASLSADVGAVVDAVGSGPVHVVTFSRGTTYAIGWLLGHPERVRSLSIGDYIPEERILPETISRRLLDGRWRGSPVLERLDEAAALKQFHAARPRSFWDDLARLQVPLLVVRSRDRVLVGDTEWSRYRALFPDAQLAEFDDSPHDIFRPDRGRFPRLVAQHVDRADTHH